MSKLNYIHFTLVLSIYGSHRYITIKKKWFISYALQEFSGFSLQESGILVVHHSCRAISSSDCIQSSSTVWVHMPQLLLAYREKCNLGRLHKSFEIIRKIVIFSLLLLWNSNYGNASRLLQYCSSLLSSFWWNLPNTWDNLLWSCACSSLVFYFV